MKMVSTSDPSNIPVITCIQIVNKKIKDKTSRREYRMIGNGGDQYNRKKTSTNAVSTGKVKDKRESNASTNKKLAIQS